MATHVGLLHLLLHVPQANSLKEKRSAVKSFKQRIRNRFNVSVAEVDGQETHRRCTLAVSMVGTDRRYLEGALQQIINAAAAHRDMILTDQQLQWL